MSRFSDSRDPNGIGFLILQDHGYRDKDVPDYARGGLVGVRVKGRRDLANQDGRWEEDRFARGVLGGGVFWGRNEERAGAWQFAWPSVLARQTTQRGRDRGEITPPRTEATPTAVGDSGDPGGEPVATETAAGSDPAGSGFSRVSNAAVSASLPGRLLNDQLRKVGGKIVSDLRDAGIAPAFITPQGAVSGGGAVIVGSPVTFDESVGGIFGLGVPAWQIGFPAPENSIPLFGVNVPAFNPMFVIFREPNKDDKPDTVQDTANKAWYQAGQSQPTYPSKILPVTSRWQPDGRYQKLFPGKPQGWPDFPDGYYTITLDSSEEHEQVELPMSADPRLICPSVPGYGSFGSIVSDVDTLGGIDIERQARLQSAWRVVKGPAGEGGMLLANSEDKKSIKKGGFANVLSWNIGPAGTWETFGGMVTDYPDTGGNRDFRVHGMVSAHSGGPFDCGGMEDIHDFGRDEDGLPIRPVHISTQTKYRRPQAPADGFEDGTMFFESEYRQGADLAIPVAVHLAYNPVSFMWQWWTTSAVYTVTPPDVPGPPSPPPGPPTGGGGETTPPAGPGGPVGPPGGGEGEGGRDRGPKRPDKGVPGGYGKFDFTPSSVRGGASGPDAPFRPLVATVQETAFPSIAGRPQKVQEGVPDLQHSFLHSDAQRKEHDSTAPLTARLVAYGAQGGPAGGPYMPGDREWSYTQSPSRSQYRGGTASGGLALLSPEVNLSDIDDDLAPDGVTKSTSYLTATPGTCFASGLPELSSGGVKTGYSFGDDGSGNLTFYAHDSVGDKTQVLQLTSGQLLDFLDHAEIEVSGGSVAQSGVTTTPQKLTAFDTDGTSQGATPDHTDDSITVAKAGTYLIAFSMSFDADANTTWTFHLRVNGAEQNEGAHATHTNSGDEESCSFTALKVLAASDVLTVYVESDQAGGAELTVDFAQLTAVRIR